MVRDAMTKVVAITECGCSAARKIHVNADACISTVPCVVSLTVLVGGLLLLF